MSLRVMLFLVAPMIIAGCQTTSSEDASMVAPTSSSEAAGISTQVAAGETTDANDPTLPEGARMLAKGEDPTAAGDPDEVLCKTTGRTGSRISKKRICMTRAEWDANYERSKRGMNDFKDDKSMGTPMQ